MTRIRLRAALLVLPLVAVPVVLGAVPAYAEDVTVPGCYGAGDAIVCNLTVTYTGVPGVEFYSETVPVCAGTCYDVPVTFVRADFSEAFRVCASWTDGAGNPQGTCDPGFVDRLLHPPPCACGVDE